MDISRRVFLQSGSLLALSLAGGPQLAQAAGLVLSRPLQEYGYAQIEFASGLHEQQRLQTLAVLMELNQDSLVRPFRVGAGLPAPGEDLPGWYATGAFCPAHCFGQWVSALCRNYAVAPDPAVRARAISWIWAYANAISPEFYRTLRYPAYTYDKLVIALLDAHRYLDMPDALALLDRTTAAALPSLPTKAMNREEMRLLPHIDESYCWDESYTLPENQFLAYQLGAGRRYLDQARRFLNDEHFFTPLAQGQNVLPGHHAYSYANSLSSAVQAYLVGGSRKHLRAAVNAFDFLESTQSFATGGWGPDELFREPGSGELGASLKSTHKGFETPCGSYAHFKLTRALLRITRDPRYGDSLEKVMYNTVLGAKPLQSDGRAFYYSDYNFAGQKAYFGDAWPCCAGTLPQVTADYRLNVYLSSPEGPWVNLYIPSTLRWQQDGAAVTLQQTGNYPFDSQVTLQVQCDRERDFCLRLRIPAWAEGAVCRVNGQAQPIQAVQPGTFVALTRSWRDGDRVELELPLPLRLLPVDPQHPNTVALVRGPLVLFGLAPTPSTLTRSQLLGATRTGATSWKAADTELRPFTAIGNEPYTTYFELDS